jgi:hypothetical protein
VDELNRAPSSVYWSILGKRVLMRIFGLKRDEVRGVWKEELHNNELHNLSCITIVITPRNLKWDRYARRLERIRNAS